MNSDTEKGGPRTVRLFCFFGVLRAGWVGCALGAQHQHSTPQCPSKNRHHSPTFPRLENKKRKKLHQPLAKLKKVITFALALKPKAT